MHAERKDDNSGNIDIELKRRIFNEGQKGDGQRLLNGRYLMLFPAVFRTTRYQVKQALARVVRSSISSWLLDPRY